MCVVLSLSLVVVAGLVGSQEGVELWEFWEGGTYGVEKSLLSVLAFGEPSLLATT